MTQDQHVRTLQHLLVRGNDFGEILYYEDPDMEFISFFDLVTGPMNFFRFRVGQNALGTLRTPP